MMKKLPKVKPRDRRTEGIDIFGKRRPRDIDQYQDEIIRQMEEMDSFAAGGRVGFSEGELVSPEQVLMVRPEKGGPIPDELVDRARQKRMSLTGKIPPRPEEDEEITEQILREILSPGVNEDSIADQMYNMQMQEMMNPRMGRAYGGIMQVAPGVPAGMELDYRNTGGFIPMGGPEKADDVPAMLSKNEFVMTADAVRGMGDGDINTGAQRMYDLMNNMEAKV